MPQAKIKSGLIVTLFSGFVGGFRFVVDYLYIDPPYNTQNNEFIYADRFKRSSWLTMMTNRLELAQYLLNDKGVAFVSIDDNEQAYCKALMDEVFNGGGGG